MTTHNKAVRLNLEYYRKAAKALLKAAQAGDESAFARIARYSGRGHKGHALHEAQLTIAREQGFASWPKFRAYLIELSLDYKSLAADFIDASVADRGQRAEQMLARNPKLAGAGFYAALVLGDFRNVERVLDQYPEMLNEKGGARQWEPLIYVCFSRFANRASERAGALTETARILCSRGADASAAYVHTSFPDHPKLSCLYGAVGVNNNPAIALILLEAGARTDDGESVYHSTEHADLECLRLLLKHGAAVNGTNSLRHVLDYENEEGLRLLLEAGGNQNEINERGDTALHWAVWRGRSAQIAAVLLDAGADINARRNDGRTAYALAVRSGQTATARLLEERGANTELSEADRSLGALADSTSFSEKPAGLPISEDAERLLVEFVSSHSTAGVTALLKAGVPTNTIGEGGGTALHWACWKGYADLVEMLLAHGASITIEDTTYHATPPGWLMHGLNNSLERDGDYAGAARLLLSAGANFAASDIPTGDDAVDEVLRGHGLI